MQWVELLFHVDPDGGSGLFEAALALVAVLGSAAAMCTFRVRRSRREAFRR